MARHGSCTVHSDNCISKRCYECQKKYARERQRRYRSNKPKKVSSVLNRKLSKYASVLCEHCKYKQFNYYCEHCKKSYRRAKVHSSRHKKKSDKNVHTDNNGQNEYVSNDVEQINDENSEYCPKQRNHVKETVVTDIHSTIQENLVLNPNNETVDRRHNEQTPTKILSKKSIQNRTSQINKSLPKTPRRRKQVLDYFYKKSSHTEKVNAMKCLFPQYEEHLRGELYKNMRQKNPKSEKSYEILSNIHENTVIDNINGLKRTYGLSSSKAKDLFTNNKTQRKSYKPIINEKTVQNIEDFYLRGDISYCDGSLKNNSKKKGPARFMRISYEEAFKMFKLENEHVKISFTKFYLLRPINMKPLSSTQMLFCLCIYCANVKLKLNALKLTEVSEVYILYKKLLCGTLCENKKITHNSCIFRKCTSCSTWEKTIKSLIPQNIDTNRNIEWFAWVTETFVTQANKTSRRKTLIRKSGTYMECLNELIQIDILKPNIGFTFVQHYFTQYYQYKMYAECKENLQDYEVILLQDFANNIELKNQDEVKGAFYSTTQITVHPTVVYVKLPKEDKPRRLVITHLSDIKQHTAHMVHFITTDCIKYITVKFNVASWKNIYVWSDGCCSQFKGKTSFFYMEKSKYKIERHFFGSEHGKSESDGETGRFSRAMSDAFKSRLYHIKGALDTIKFLKKKFNDEKYVFRNIQESDLNPVLEHFAGTNLKVLSGNCTRSLHNIISQGNGLYLTRPFSCFCNKCKTEQYFQCKNKIFTNGNFIQRKLQSNVVNISNDENLENEDNYDREDDNIENIDDVSEIEIMQEEINHEDLQIDRFIVARVKSQNKKKKSELYVAKIVARNNSLENPIKVEYFKHFEEHQDVFVRYNLFENKTYDVGFDEIVMLLPDPTTSRRKEKFCFSGSIHLRNKNKKSL